MKSYSQLGEEEREKIAEMLNDSLNQTEIAKEIGCNKSTISREINRNKTKRKVEIRSRVKKSVPSGYIYDSEKAKKKTENRRKAKGREQLWWRKNKDLKEWVELKIKAGWSPVIISGRAKFEGLGNVSHEAIYQYVYRLEIRHKQLWRCLIRSHKKRKKKLDRKSKKISKIPNRIDIDQRPILANLREEFGHWEADSVVGKMGTLPALHTEIERASRKFFIRRMTRKTAQNTADAMIDIWENMPTAAVKTTTPDNGSEFCDWQRVHKSLGIDFYFAKPYHSWERGANERANGIIRRFFPKKTDFSLVSNQEIQAVEDYINNRPMKCLGYLTPNEAFQQMIISCT